MPVTQAEAQAVTLAFTRDYPGALELAYKFRKDTTDLYGQFASEVPRDMKGGYVPRETIHDGRVYRGRVDVPLQKVDGAGDLMKTLRHEVLGHYGANTFAPAEKRALLDGLIASREEPSLKPLWNDIDQRYAGQSWDVRAEEVFALRCEGIEPGQHQAVDQARQRGQQSFMETCIARTRPMRDDDLQNIACMVAQGLRDRSRTQQTFPLFNELFRKDGNMADSSDVQKELMRKHDERDTRLAMQGLNEIDLERRAGKELERDEFIIPRRIINAYTEVDGKFFAKDSNRVMFEDKGQKLTTSTTDKQAIADMVMYARAKQWDSLKLSGTPEFRREAWLQAESQGIRTQGYTPKDSDLAALKTLTEERQKNVITPVQERQKERETSQVVAPRHDLNKNQAALHDEATKALAGNIQALQKNPALADRSVADLEKLAYWRGIVTEDNKLQPKPARDEALVRFDKMAEDPQFVKRLDHETKASIDDKTIDQVARTQKRDTHEHSL